jgi:hypothetical protein
LKLLGSETLEFPGREVVEPLRWEVGLFGASRDRFGGSLLSGGRLYSGEIGDSCEAHLTLRTNRVSHCELLSDSLE